MCARPRVPGVGQRGAGNPGLCQEPPPIPCDMRSQSTFHGRASRIEGDREEPSPSHGLCFWSDCAAPHGAALPVITWALARRPRSHIKVGVAAHLRMGWALEQLHPVPIPQSKMKSWTVETDSGWGQNSSSATYSVALGKLPNLSDTQFPHLQNRGCMNICPGGLKDVMHVEHSASSWLCAPPPTWVPFPYIW